MEFPCGLCREPLDSLDQLKKHLKGEHEVVKYRLDLVVALSTFSTSEEKRLVEEGKKRLVIMEESGIWHKEGDLFSGASQATPKIQEIKKETESQGLAREIAEINKILMDNNEEEEDDLEVLEVIGNITRGNIDASTATKIKEEPVTETPPPSPVPDDERLLMEDIDDLDIQILEIINKMPTKTGEGAFGKKIKLEPGVETPPLSPISSTELNVTSVKVEVDVTEPQIEMLIDGVAQTMELEEEEEEEKEEEEVEGEAVDESLPFCRLCYITFSSHTEQLPHEQKVNYFQPTLFFFFFNISSSIGALF